MLTSLMTAQVKGHLQYEQKTEIDRLPGATTNVSNLIILGGLIFLFFFRLSSIYKNIEVVFYLKKIRSTSL